QFVNASGGNPGPIPPPSDGGGNPDPTPPSDGGGNPYPTPPSDGGGNPDPTPPSDGGGNPDPTPPSDGGGNPDPTPPVDDDDLGPEDTPFDDDDDYSAPATPPADGGTDNSDSANIGEYGSLDAVNHQWQTVTLDSDYINPVVIVSDPTFKGSDPAVVRLQNITDNSFQIRLQEPNYKDGNHTNEAISYLVVEAGDWTLSDGTRLSAGTYDTNRLTSKGFDTVDLTGFDYAPTILSQVQTFKGSDWVTTRTTGQSSNSFKLAMQEEEAGNKGGHVRETVGWFAIDQGVASDGDTLLQGGMTDRDHNHTTSTVNFEQSFNAAPSLIAKLGSHYGSDTANLRIDGITNNSFGVRVHEERSLDREINHTFESVSFVALQGQEGTLTGVAV
ncbi:MAG: hypothetical protein F6K42_32850, partial [Leptolyngbya sp. SIO1D8]|nr:hypothetical protein [Leptolyngbya sp. SIO1D8]